MGWDMIDETACQWNRVVLLTYYWSWERHDEIAVKELCIIHPLFVMWFKLMRLPSKEIKQCHSHTVVTMVALRHHEISLKAFYCHSHTVGYGIKYDWWDSCQRNIVVSLTSCWDETWLMRLPGIEIELCHSLPVGHGMRHDDIPANTLYCHSPTAIGHGWNIMRLGLLGRQNVVFLTSCLGIKGFLRLHQVKIVYCLLSIKSNVSETAWKKCTMNLPPGASACRL